MTVIQVPEGQGIGHESFDRAQERFLAIDGTDITGRIAVSYLFVGESVQALVHDLLVAEQADKITAAKLIQAARAAIKAQGVTSYVFTVETCNTRMLERCFKAGMKAEAVSFRCSV